MTCSHTLRHLPRLLTSLGLDFLILCPSRHDARPLKARSPILKSLLGPRRILLGLSAGSCRRAMSELLDRIVRPRSPHRDQILGTLTISSINCTDRILPKIVVSRTQISQLGRSYLYMNVRHQNLIQRRADRPVRIIILLLASTRNAARSRLTRLTRITTCFDRSDRIRR